MVELCIYPLFKEFIVYTKDLTSVVDRREMLRVKIKSLAEEARIIRKEEKRVLFRKPRTFRGRTVWAGTSGPLHIELWYHRVTDVRWHARAAHLAYGLIRGLTRDQMEPKRRPLENDTDKQADKLLMVEVDRLVKKYGQAIAFLKAA